jgi:hypothetical protein
MDNRGSQMTQGATDLRLKLSDYPLGSGQSRAAARSLLEARKASEESKSGVKVVDREDGSVAETRGLADAIRAGRMRIQSGECPPPFHTSVGGEENRREGRADCLSERIRRAKERLRRAQGLEATS